MLGLSRLLRTSNPPALTLPPTRSGWLRLAAITSVAGLWFSGGCTCGSGPYQGDYLDEDRPPAMKGVEFVESEKGDPKIIGCADGQREGFADLKKNTRVAGCVGSWSGNKNLRDKGTGQACGDDIAGSKCAVPADVCAPGWHVCGFEGKGDDLRDRLDPTECDNAGPGRFNAAVSHSPSDEIEPCPTVTDKTMLPCMLNGLGAEAVCCGTDCKYGKCKDGVWKGKTKISRGTTEGCGSVSSEHNGGVMCCYDGTDDPAGGANAEPAAADAKAEGDAAGAPEGDAKAEEGAPAEGKAEEAAPAGDAKAEAAAPAGDAKAGAAAPAGDAKAEAAAPAGDAKAPKRKAAPSGGNVVE